MGALQALLPQINKFRKRLSGIFIRAQFLWSYFFNTFSFPFIRFPFFSLPIVFFFFIEFPFSTPSMRVPKFITLKKKKFISFFTIQVQLAR